MKKALTTGSVIFFVPFVAFAQSNLINLLYLAMQIINLVIPLLIAVALIVFFWGLISYVRKADSGEGRKIMIAGIVALFIMVSIWGIIRLIGNTLGIQPGSTLVAPRVDFQ